MASVMVSEVTIFHTVVLILFRPKCITDMTPSLFVCLQYFRPKNMECSVYSAHFNFSLEVKM